MRKIYLAHPLAERDYVAKEIIPLVQKRFLVVNPFKNRLERFKGLSPKEIRENQSWVRPNWVVGHDLLKIDECDGLLVYNLKGLFSVGSIFEAYYAWSDAKPVAFVMPEEKVPHPWLQYHGIIVTPGIEVAINALYEYFDDEPEWSGAMSVDWPQTYPAIGWPDPNTDPKETSDDKHDQPAFN